MRAAARHPASSRRGAGRVLPLLKAWRWCCGLALCVGLCTAQVAAQPNPAASASAPISASASAPISAGTVAAALHEAPRSRRVLLIYSRHDQAPWQAGVLAGLRQRLEAVPLEQQPALFEERLEALRIAEPAAQAAFLNLLTQRYAAMGLDLVVAEGQNAFDLLNQNPTLFPGVPRYLIGNVGRAGQPPQGTTLLSVEEDIPRATEAVLKVMPQVRKVVVVADGTPYGQAIAARLRRTGSQLSVQTALEVWSDFTYEDLYRRASQLPQGAALLWFPVFQDNTGARQPPMQTLRELAQRASVPVFSHHDVTLGHGAVGGYLISARAVGDLIGRLVLGQPLPSGPEALSASMRAYMFDDAALQRWGLDRAQLPAGSQLFNARSSVPWLAQGWHAAAVGAAVLLQALLIAALVVSQRRVRSAQSALAAEHALLEAHVAERTAELKQANEQLAALSATDALTGLANRRRFDQVLASEWARAQRSGQPLALAMLDLDWFKKYNDRYGHQAGDDCLRQVGRVVGSAARREGDLVARYGGEEFAFICVGTSASAAVIRAQAACEALEHLALPHELSRFGVVTASAGVASLMPAEGNSPELLVKLADEALYKAKSQGRNRVELALAPVAVPAE